MSLVGLVTQVYITSEKEENEKLSKSRRNNYYVKFVVFFQLFLGDFVIVDPIEEGNKVCAEIVHILYGKQIKYLKSEGLW